MIVNGIDTKDISIVVQGAVDKENTPRCLKSLRKYLPGAEVILSTWEGTNTDGLDYDIVLYNEDPGGWRDGRTDIPNNLNRQLVSSKNGIKAASRKYCIKIRSDIIFRSNRFLTYFDKFPKRDPKYQVFQERVIFCSYFFKRYLGEAQYTVQPVPFHMSDWFAFGLKEDVLLLFDVPLAKEPENTDYFFLHEMDPIRIDVLGASHQYSPEQYIFLTASKKCLEVPYFPSVIKYTSENIEFSNHVVANNCIILNPSQMSIICGKNSIDLYCTWSKNELSLPANVWEGLYRYDVFVNEYLKYCDPNYSIPNEAIKQKKRYIRWHKIFEANKLSKDALL